MFSKLLCASVVAMALAQEIPGALVCDGAGDFRARSDMHYIASCVFFPSFRARFFYSRRRRHFTSLAGALRAPVCTSQQAIRTQPLWVSVTFFAGWILLQAHPRNTLVMAQ
jgi:hypothetical protein